LVIGAALWLVACAGADCDCAGSDTFVNVGSSVPAGTSELRMCANGRCATASLADRPDLEGGRRQLAVSAGPGHDTDVVLEFLDAAGHRVRTVRAEGTRRGGGCCGPYVEFEWRAGRNRLVERR
jgi:hypothetical protein